jgi:hypothetical protein
MTSAHAQAIEAPGVSQHRNAREWTWRGRGLDGSAGKIDAKEFFHLTRLRKTAVICGKRRAAAFGYPRERLV